MSGRSPIQPGDEGSRAAARQSQRNIEVATSGVEAGSSPSTLHRRRFLQLAGGGITIFFTVGLPVDLAGELQQQRRGVPTDFNAFLRVGEDGRVTLFTGKVEMGQGAMTALPPMLAEELDVPLDMVDIILGDTDLCPWDMGTFGSLTIRSFGPLLRQAAAEARAVLLQLAGEHLELSPDRLVVRDGVIMDREHHELSVACATLTRGQRIERRLEGEARPKPRDTYTIVGRPRKRRDARAKVKGEAEYAGDVRPEGMLCAAILRPPAHGALLLEVDTSGAERVDGARVVRDGDLVAVLHEKPDLAERALGLVEARWEEPALTPDNENIFRHLEAEAPPPEVYVEAGDLETGRAASVRMVESVFHNHYVAHAPMEPHTAVASVRGDRATVWAATQAPFTAQTDAARALGIPAENVRVITPFVGGGFGGKTRNLQVGEAARLSRLAGHPVQVAWTRREEFFYDTFRPAALVKFTAGLDASNRIVLWDYDNYHAGSRSSEVKYDVPHYRVVTRGGWQQGGPAHPFSVGAWRGPASNTNAFAMESQVDLLAQEAGMDPVAFRLHNLTDERMRRVLQAAAERFGHAWEKAPSGRGHGAALTDYHGTYVAAMAEVHVDRTTGTVKVERVVCAQDMGECVNPAGAVLQVEGCITMGLGYCLSEEVRFQGGKVLDQNFGTYRLPRFSWTPAMEVILVDNPDMPPQGGGEPAITLMGGILANAVHDAVGARVYTLPMTPERVLRALG
jgi:nicotinate dehydrogenase subunit B